MPPAFLLSTGCFQLALGVLFHNVPNRIVREGFLDSEGINNLTESAECFYHRLLLAADDAGRYDGRLDVIRSKLYPVATRKVSVSDVDKAIRECVGQRLLLTYEYLGKPFLQITKWARCGNSVNSRYPDQHGQFRIEFTTLDTRDGSKEYVASSLGKNDLAETPMKTPSASHADGVGIDTNQNTETKTDTITKTIVPSALAAPPVNEAAESVYACYPRKVGKPKALAAIRKALRDVPLAELRERTVAFSALWQGHPLDFCPHPATWFNQERYNDHPDTWGPHERNEPTALEKYGAGARRNAGCAVATRDELRRAAEKRMAAG
jgi:hypothetical protein